MTAQKIQNFENHRSSDPLLFYTPALFLATLALAGIDLIRNLNFTSLGVILMIPPLAVMCLRIRSYPLVVQDRIIRLEMRLRLAQVLRGDLAGKGEELTAQQLIGLRFASDGELPGLVRQVLEERLMKADDIKRRIRDWQPDWLRV